MSSPIARNILSNIGVVVIGRNEGERLLYCLNSFIDDAQHVVYVDSGSVDNSLNVAKGLGIEGIGLDLSIPFTAGRARNEGFYRLLQMSPKLKYVQFVDGDCTLVGDWLNLAATTLETLTDVGVVCGRCRERYPERSVYNLLCDMEWDTPTGETMACGGDFMVRSSLFEEMGGFNTSLIAGEEPELCVRIREKDWKIWRVAEEMALHDANMTCIQQWWKRNVRAGYAFAEAVFMRGRKPEYHGVRASIRIWLWGFFIPVTVLLAALIDLWFVVLLLVYPIQIIRIIAKMGIGKSSSWFYGFFIMLGKFPELQGQIKFLFDKLFMRKSVIIEYK